jgi:polyisoprenoid-binding protein YceI
VGSNLNNLGFIVALFYPYLICFTLKGERRHMHLQRPQWMRFLVVLSLLAGLTLAGCFGSSDDEETPEDPPPTATAAPAAQPEPTATPTESAPAADASATEAEAEPAASDEETAGRQTFQIDQAQSEARFIVNEMLFGNPNEVVGKTTEVSGTIDIDLDDPTQTQISPIQINARSLATDNRFRNRSVNRLILQSNRDEYQYITFTPTSIEGLPAEAKAGETLSLQVSGDLQIRDIVQPVTFAVTVTADSPAQLTGLAQTHVQRADFDLTIPSVEGVADVTEDVRLELEFVATANP